MYLSHVTTELYMKDVDIFYSVKIVSYDLDTKGL